MRRSCRVIGQRTVFWLVALVAAGLLAIPVECAASAGPHSIFVGPTPARDERDPTSAHAGHHGRPSVPVAPAPPASAHADHGAQPASDSAAGAGSGTAGVQVDRERRAEGATTVQSGPASGTLADSVVPAIVEPLGLAAPRSPQPTPVLGPLHDLSGRPLPAPIPPPP